MPHVSPGGVRDDNLDLAGVAGRRLHRSRRPRGCFTRRPVARLVSSSVGSPPANSRTSALRGFDSLGRRCPSSSVAQEILAGAAADALPRMEHNAKRADRLQVAEHRRVSKHCGGAPRPRPALAGRPWAGKRPGESAVAILAERKSARRRRDRSSDSGHENPSRRNPRSVRVLADHRAQGILVWRTQSGTPVWTMGFEPGRFGGGPCDLPGCAASANRSVSFARWFSVH